MDIDWNRVCDRLIEKARSEMAFATEPLDYAKAHIYGTFVEIILAEIAVAERVEDDRRHS